MLHDFGLNNPLLCLVVWVFRPIREFFIPMETSPLPVKGCKVWPLFGTHDHWAVRVVWRATSYCDTEHPFLLVISDDPWHSHLLPSVFAVELSLLVFTTRSVATVIQTPNFRLRGDCSNPMRHRRGSNTWNLSAIFNPVRSFNKYQIVDLIPVM